MYSLLITNTKATINNLYETNDYTANRRFRYKSTIIVHYGLLDHRIHLLSKALSMNHYGSEKKIL